MYLSMTKTAINTVLVGNRLIHGYKMSVKYWLTCLKVVLKPSLHNLLQAKMITNYICMFQPRDKSVYIIYSFASVGFGTGTCIF